MTQVMSVVNLPGVLSGLRKDLGAFTVILVDDRGHIMAQTGEFPEPSFESIWITPLMASVSSTNKVSRLLGRPQVEGALVLRGLAFELVLAPVDGYTLVVVVQPDSTRASLLRAFEAVLAAQVALQSILDGIRVPQIAEDITPPPLASDLQTVAPMQPLESEPDLAKFEHFLTTTTAVKAKDADAFWEQASSDYPVDGGNPDAISYEQARQLGLAPNQAQHKQ
jgi:hypothetical protein